MRELATIDPTFVELLLERHVCVAFSGGKDSIAMWNALLRHGVRPVAAYHLEAVPGMSFVDTFLSECEDHYGVPITRLPSPALVSALRGGVLQSPMTFDAAIALPKWTTDDLDDWVRDRGCIHAAGIREHDSLCRRRAVKQGGAWNERRGRVWPIYNFTKLDVLAEIEAGGLKLPREYRLFGRSFDGYRHARYLKETYPEDYERIRAFFPLIEAEEVRARRWENTTPSTPR